MDGRQILDGMNDDVIFGIYNGQAPWQCDVPEGFVRNGATLHGEPGEVHGIGRLHLDCLANRFGYDSTNWNARVLADSRYVDVIPDVRFFTTFDVKRHRDEANGLVSTSLGFETLFNDDCAVDEICPVVPRLAEWKPDRATRILIADLYRRQGLVPVDSERMRSGIYDAVKALEGRDDTGFRFAARDDLAQAICRNIAACRISQACGHGWRAEEAGVIDPASVAAAVRQDPFWLARACYEAEIRYAALLYPEGFARAHGGPARYRDGIEHSFDRMRGEEKRQYLAVPFEDNAEVKAKGGRFDRVAKAWYVPSSADINDFAKWDRPSEMSPEAEFAETMRHHGLAIEGDAVMDGAPHRVMLEGQRPGASPAGSYTGYLDGRPAGHFTNFRDGDGKAVKWVASGHRVDPELRSATAREIEAKRDARRRELATKQEAAAGRAEALWSKADIHQAGMPHRYLRQKDVEAFGVGVSADRQTLYVPAQDIDGKIWSLQMIFTDGQDVQVKKRFLKDSRKEGCFFILDKQNRFGREPVLFSEGYSTAASVHEATGYRPVVVTFDAHNLKSVAVALRSEISNQPFIFLADDDDRLAVNKGVKYATEAAEAAGGSAVVAPRFDAEGLAAGLTDFNDLHQHAGIEAVSRQVHAALGPIFRNFRVRQMGTDKDEARLYQSEEVAPALTSKWEQVMAEELGRQGAGRPGNSKPGRGR